MIIITVVLHEYVKIAYSFVSENKLLYHCHENVK